MLLCVLILSVVLSNAHFVAFFFFFQAEDGIRDLVRSRGLGDVYKRQAVSMPKDVIDRAVKKSQMGDAADYTEIRYEGYGLSLINI